MNDRPYDAVVAFGKLERDAHGVSPVQLQRFLRNQLSDSDARKTFAAMSQGGVTHEQLASRLGLPPRAVTDVDIKRLRHLLSLWQRWAMDDAEGWLTIGTSHRGEAQ